MRRRFSRVIIFAIIVIGLGLGYNFILAHFSGDGKASPKEALPHDDSYIWVEGPKNEQEQRFFFLTNGNYFGTQVVTENFKGWSSGSRTSSQLPKSLKENTVTTAYSDGKILFGLIKPGGEVKVMVNDHFTKRIPLTTIAMEALKKYNVQGYEIWYIDMSELENSSYFSIEVLDENNSLIHELLI